MADALQDTIAAEIRAELGRQHLSQTALAERLGLSNATVSSKLRGDTNITVNDLARIAAALNVSVSGFLPAKAA